MISPGQTANIGVIDMFAAPGAVLGRQIIRARKSNVEFKGEIEVTVREATMSELQNLNNNMNGNNHNRHINNNNNNNNNNFDTDNLDPENNDQPQIQIAQQMTKNFININNLRNFGNSLVNNDQCNICSQQANNQNNNNNNNNNFHSLNAIQTNNNNNNNNGPNTQIHSNFMEETIVFNNNEAAMGINDFNNQQQKQQQRNFIIASNNLMNSNENENTQNKDDSSIQIGSNAIVLKSNFTGRVLVGSIIYPYYQSLFWIESVWKSKYEMPKYTSTIRDVSITNEFLTAIEIKSVTLNSSSFTVLDYERGLVILPGKSAVVCKVKFHPIATQQPSKSFYDANLEIGTNISVQTVPLHIYTGKLRIENTHMPHDTGTAKTFTQHSLVCFCFCLFYFHHH